MSLSRAAVRAVALGALALVVLTDGVDGLSASRRLDSHRSHDGRPNVHLEQASEVTRRPSLARVSVLRGGASAVAKSSTASLVRTLKVGLIFFLWYAFNIWYSLVAKMVLQFWKSPWLFTILQLGIGSLWVALQWVPLPTFGLGGTHEKTFTLRPVPQLSFAELRALLPIASCLAAGHLASTFAMFYGTVAFANVVKTAEPIFTCMFSALLLGQFFSLPVYLTLLPIMGGVVRARTPSAERARRAPGAVRSRASHRAPARAHPAHPRFRLTQAYASAKELQFSWVSLLTAMASNVAFALRAILAKVSMRAAADNNMSPANLFAVVNTLAFAVLLPVALLVEARGAGAGWSEAIAKGTTAGDLLKLIMITGVTYYLYNELAFMCLGVVHPVTHAVANTIKRVAVIAISIIYFKNPVTKEGIIGSAVAVVGVMLYSITLNNEQAAKVAALEAAKQGKKGK